MAVVLEFAAFQELSRTLDDYDRFHDERRSAEWIDLFTPDASFVLHGETFTGHEGLARFVAGRRDGAGKHHHGFPIVTGVGGGEVTLEVDYVGYRRAPGQIVVGGTGRYVDRLRRDADRWRFVERRIDAALRDDAAIEHPRTVRPAGA